METKFYNKIVDENIYLKKLSNNIKCYIIPKKGYVEKQAMFAVNYGSNDNNFEIGGKKYNMPKGIAHFLEHKLFEEKDIDIFEEFSKIGGNVNAFTNCTSTSYYFNCTENFDKNLKLLLNFVSNPYFTEENVEKEKGIITQEIRMYDDDPMWQVYFNMLDNMYINHPVKYSIAGDAKSINEITKDMLYECYNNFYSQSNSILVCCGDLENDSIYKIAEDNLNLNNSDKIKRIYGNESDEVKQNIVEKNMEIDRPFFNLGFKETDFSLPIEKRICETKILLDIMFGESSSFFEKLYNKGIIDNSFSFQYFSGLSFGCSILSGFSDNPKEIQKYIINEVKETLNKGIDESVFLRAKNKSIGRFIRGFNFIDSIASSQIDYFAKNIEIFDIIEQYQHMDLKDLSKRLQQHFNEDKLVLSIIKP